MTEHEQVLRDRKRERDRIYRERNAEKLRAAAKVREQRRRDAGLVAAWKAKPGVMESIRARKERYRRAAGVQKRGQISKLKQLASDDRSSQRRAFMSNFIGPPTPRSSLSPAEYYRWRMRNDVDFYARELDRAQRYKARTRHRYKDSILRWAEMPSAIKEVKHIKYLIARHIERKQCNENDQ